MAWSWTNLCSARSSGSADRVPFESGSPVAQPTNRYLHTPIASLRCTVSHGFPPNNASICSYVLPSRRQERASSLWLRQYRLLLPSNDKWFWCQVHFKILLLFWFHFDFIQVIRTPVFRSFESARRTSKHRTAIIKISTFVICECRRAFKLSKKSNLLDGKNRLNLKPWI